MAQWIEDYRENKHEVKSIADANNIVKHVTVRDAKIGVEVGQNII